MRARVIKIFTLLAADMLLGAFVLDVVKPVRARFYVRFAPIAISELLLPISGFILFFATTFLVIRLLLITRIEFREGKITWDRPSTKIKAAPGSNLLLIVEFLFSPKTVENVFRPIVADWRTEYFTALREERRWKARWINVRYIFSFGKAIGLSKFLSIVRSVAQR